MLFFLTATVKNMPIEPRTALHQFPCTGGEPAFATNGDPQLNPFSAIQSLPTRLTSQQLRAFARILHAFDNVMAAMTATLAVWQRRHRDRRHLAGLNEHMLRDIGVGFVDVEHEISKPFWRG